MGSGPDGLEVASERALVEVHVGQIVEGQSPPDQLAVRGFVEASVGGQVDIATS
jgi:hypothetical protein